VKRAILVLSLAVLAAGCGEKAQTATASTKKSDAKAWEGVVAADGTNVVGSWKAGDQKAWEEQLRVRAQGQNEYTRSAPTSSPQ
jgi:hypothetical protein